MSANQDEIKRGESIWVFEQTIDHWPGTVVRLGKKFAVIKSSRKHNFTLNDTAKDFQFPENQTFLIQYRDISRKILC